LRFPLQQNTHSGIFVQAHAICADLHQSTSVPLALLDHNVIGRLMTAVHFGADEPWLFEPRCRNIKRRAQCLAARVW
jgi:hypothetical protein